MGDGIQDAILWVTPFPDGPETWCFQVGKHASSPNKNDVESWKENLRKEG